MPHLPGSLRNTAVWTALAILLLLWPGLVLTAPDYPSLGMAGTTRCKLHDRLAPVRRYLAVVLVFGIGTGGLTDVFFMSELPKVMLVVMGSAIVYLVRTADRTDD